MKDDKIYADGSLELFDAASDLFTDKVMTARKVKDRQIFDLAIKALDYYRDYLKQNQPYDYTTGTYTDLNPVYKPKACWAPYKPGEPYKSKVDVVDCYANMVGILTAPEVTCDPSKGTVLHIPAANIISMGSNYVSGTVVRTVEYLDKAGGA